MTTKYSLLTHLTLASLASFCSGMKSRVSPVERSIVITLCWGASTLVLTYNKDPWFVILCHSKSVRRCEAGKVSHIVVRNILVNDFLPRHLRRNAVLTKLCDPHEILLKVWGLVMLGKKIKLGTLPWKYPCMYIRRYIWRPLKCLLHIPTEGVPCLVAR